MKIRTPIVVLISMALLTAAIPAWAPDAFSEGLRLFNEGRWQQAAERLSVAAERSPSDPAVRLTAGVGLANIRQYDKAAAQFEAAARLTPDWVLPQLLLDGTYAEMGHVARAREARNRASRLLSSGGAIGGPAGSDALLISELATHPENAIANCLLGDLMQLQGKLELAKDYYIRASRLSPKWAKPVFNLGLANLPSDAKAAESNFDQAIRLDPQNRRIFLWQGDAYLQQRRYADAITAYANAAQDQALAPEANTRIGNAQMQAGNYQLATEQFRQASRQAPEDARPIAGEAQVLRSTGKLKEAETKFDEAAQVLASNQAAPPSQAVVQQQIAEVRVEMGKTDQALESLKMGYQIHPINANAFALVSAQVSAGKLADGIAEYESLLKKDRNNRTALIYLLSAYKASRNWTGVVDIGNRLVSIDPSNAHIYHAEVGAAYLRAGNKDSAVDAYMRAMNAGNAGSWAETARHAAGSGALTALTDRAAKAFRATPKRSIGVVLYELRSAADDAQGMVEVADRLVKLYPDDPALWLRLGQACEQTGDREMALLAYARAASGPDIEAAAAARARVAALQQK